MLFVKSAELKTGMRLAKPIYDRNGVLLYERNTKLTLSGIESVKNFGLIGLYILEPAEPVPPMTDSDIEFEKFQTMGVFSIKEDMNFIIRGRTHKGLATLVNTIVKNYGRTEKRVNFMQNIRSSEDYVYKHSVNMGILVALISNQLNLSYMEQSDVIIAGLLHDIGKISLPYEIKVKYGEYTEEDQQVVAKYVKDGINMVRADLSISQGVKQIITQYQNIVLGESEIDPDRLYIGTKIMVVADAFDSMTAMRLNVEPMSTLAAIKKLLGDDDYDQEIVEALVASVDILYPGVCIELSNQEKALVITANERNVLRPVVLTFGTNEVYDLSDKKVYQKIKISDIMRTMDNRIKVDQERLREYMIK